MTAAVATAPSIANPTAAPGRRRVVMAWLVIVIGLVVVWEGAKWLFGDPWRIHTSLLGLPIDIEHIPPFKSRIATDLSLPHVWKVVGAFIEPAQRNGPPLGLILAGQALFTFREALIGFVFGGLLGLLLGVGFVHSKLAERAFVPYVVASQTVPILAISPLIVVATKAGWVSVAIISAYLTFFPVTIAALRGLRAADPRAFELMRSYAATKRNVLWKLRLPTSVPYLFSSLRVAAAASVIGAIIGELPSGIPDGLGSALLNYNQYYTSGPERLWATIVMCSIVGLGFVGLVRLGEVLLTRNRYRPQESR
ncbi:MAG TPA: ABC transporter permease subunit [Candidatus Polarisedimenticolia bacterium]|nr:ABC transporter permease subunit [Candidatus Polarisedimenticolia bacterium]